MCPSLPRHPRREEDQLGFGPMSSWTLGVRVVVMLLLILAEVGVVLLGLFVPPRPSYVFPMLRDFFISRVARLVYPSLRRAFMAPQIESSMRATLLLSTPAFVPLNPITPSFSIPSPPLPKAQPQDPLRLLPPRIPMTIPFHNPPLLIQSHYPSLVPSSAPVPAIYIIRVCDHQLEWAVPVPPVAE